MGVPANEMGDYDTEELVVVQGIIDAYFEEGDGLVLVDYKTDKTRSARTLLGYYKTQIDYYAKALEQMTGKKVKEKMIYSLTMQQEIPCD
jgi:ATP-dependent helicase/nuclease subunit A